ncbi:hypothetical protein [Rhizobium sp. Root708]|uniref:hypothetical protein n=1 Tax=Rhizobium sp. Root708 TaxID=1736592 RepID=UPI001AED11A5|nr:hypothetical protein [Rhizobium sp. Root708]
MIIGKRNGATHERIGVVEAVTEENGLLHCSGSAHDSHIDPTLVKRALIDTSSIMSDKVYPRIDFNREDGETLFAIVGFGGLEPFEAALEGLNIVVDPSIPARPPRPERQPVSPGDPGLAPLNAALDSGQAVTITFEEPGFTQRWTGVIPKVSPGMGFINVMTDDFHLHLLGSTVGAWRQDEVDGTTILRALDHDAKETGLTVRAIDPLAFASAPVYAETAP